MFSLLLFSAVSYICVCRYMDLKQQWLEYASKQLSASPPMIRLDMLIWIHVALWLWENIFILDLAEKPENLARCLLLNLFSLLKQYFVSVLISDVKYLEPVLKMREQPGFEPVWACICVFSGASSRQILFALRVTAHTPKFYSRDILLVFGQYQPLTDVSIMLKQSVYSTKSDVAVSYSPITIDISDFWSLHMIIGSSI